MASTLGLVVYGLTTAGLAALVLVAQRDRGFPLPLSRRAGAVVLGLDSVLGWIALAGDESLYGSPGWLMSLALMGAANLVASLGVLLRAVSLPLWLRVVTAASCFVATPALAVLVA